MKKTAFTLMELLITLAIISVVVVLTIPRLVGDTSSKSNLTMLKSTYSQFDDMMSQALIDQGVRDVIDLEFSGDDNSKKLSSFMNNYFDVSKDCGESTTGCFASAYANHNKVQITSPFAYESDSIAESVVLANGAAIGLFIDFSAGSDDNMYVWIDVNAQKVPNVFGKDMFVAKINPDGHLGVAVAPSDFGTYKNTCNENNDARVGEACLSLLRAKNWDIKNYMN